MLFKSIKFNMNFSTYRFFKIKFIFIVFDGKEIVIKKILVIPNANIRHKLYKLDKNITKKWLLFKSSLNCHDLPLYTSLEF